MKRIYVLNCPACPFYIEATMGDPGCSATMADFVTPDLVKNAAGAWEAAGPPPDGCPLRTGEIVIALGAVGPATIPAGAP